MKWQDISVEIKTLSPGSCLPLPWGYVMKRMGKGKIMDFSETIVVYGFKLLTDDQSDKKFLLTSKLCPLEAVCPLSQGYIHALNHEKHCIKSDFKEIFWNLHQMTKVTRCSCWHQNFVPKGFSAPAQGLYTCTCIKILKKKCIKSDFKEIFFKLIANDRSDRRFLLTSKFCSLRLSALTCGYIHLLHHENICIKSEVEEILFKIPINDHSDEAFTLTSRFWPKWVDCPCPMAMFYYFSSITTDFNISSARRWAIQDQWSSGFNIW